MREKTSTEPLLVQSSKDAPHKLNRTTTSPPLLQFGRYKKLVFFNLVTPS